MLINNQTLVDALNQLLSKFGFSFALGDTVDSELLAQICERYGAWLENSYTADIIITWVFHIFSLLCIIIPITLLRKKNRGIDEFIGVMMFVGFVGAIITTPLTIYFIRKLIEAQTFPEAIIFEKIQDALYPN